jgi:hypothetical protein
MMESMLDWLDDSMVVVKAKKLVGKMVVLMVGYLE